MIAFTALLSTLPVAKKDEKGYMKSSFTLTSHSFQLPLTLMFWLAMNDNTKEHILRRQY